jgi:hypothetical protein
MALAKAVARDGHHLSAHQRLVYLALVLPFLAKQEIEILLGKKEQRLKWHERMQGFGDSFSPIYQNRHTPEEVVELFRQEGFEAIEFRVPGEIRLRCPGRPRVPARVRSPAPDGAITESRPRER